MLQKGRGTPCLPHLVAAALGRRVSPGCPVCRTAAELPAPAFRHPCVSERHVLTVCPAEASCTLTPFNELGSTGEYVLQKSSFLDFLTAGRTSSFGLSHQSCRQKQVQQCISWSCCIRCCRKLSHQRINTFLASEYLIFVLINCPFHFSFHTH